MSLPAFRYFRCRLRTRVLLANADQPGWLLWLLRRSWGDFRKGLTRAREKSPGVCLPPGLFLNVHKIRVDSDNKR
jgi:hypothetical protein